MSPDRTSPSSGNSAGQTPGHGRAPIVAVPLDGTEQSLAALPVARALADLQGAVLHIIHVGESTRRPRELLGKLGLLPEQIHGATISQTTGEPAAGIVRLATEWGSLLIVLCTYTVPPKNHGDLGKVAEEVMRRAPCPVVLVRPERGPGPWHLRRILLPHDGTPTTAAAIGPAADLAVRAGAELIVVHITGPAVARSAEPGTLAGPRYLDQPQHDWPSWEKEFVGRLTALGHSPATLKLRLLLSKGEPGAEIVRVASERGANLVVLAWRGSLEAKRAAVIKTVLHEELCPILVVRAEAK